MISAYAFSDLEPSSLLIGTDGQEKNAAFNFLSQSVHPIRNKLGHLKLMNDFRFQRSQQQIREENLCGFKRGRFYLGMKILILFSLYL